MIALLASPGWGQSTFTEKCAQPGVIHCFPFDNFSEIQKAYWDQTDSVLNAEMLRRGFVYGDMSWTSRGPNEAVSVGRRSTGGFQIPTIDNTVFADGGGSLRFDTPGQSGAAGAEYLNNFNGVLGGSPPYIAPGSPWGNIVYIQYKIRVNDSMLNTTIQEAGGSGFFGKWKGTLSTGADGTILINSGPPADPFKSGMVGQRFSLYDGICTGSYNDLIITQFIDSTHIKVNANVGSNLSGRWGQTGAITGGWKSSMIVSQPPYGDTFNELVINDGYECGYPLWYTNKGVWSVNQFTKPFVADQWIEITQRVELINDAGHSDHITMWIDGTQVIDTMITGVDGRIDWGTNPNYGPGQIYLLTYHTNKDPNQVHPMASTWYDDLIISTQPIAMGGTPPQTPAKPTGLRLR